MRRTGVILLSLLLSAPATAERDASLIGLEQALTEAANAPVVEGTRRAAREKRTINERISGAIGNPTVTALGGRRPDLLPPSIEFEVGVSQPFNLGGLSGARRRSATLEADAIESLSGSLALVHQIDAAATWFGLWEAEHDLARARQEAEIAESFFSKVERAATLGAMTAVEVSDARAYAAEAQLSAINAEGDLFDAGLALARALGRAATSPLRASLEVPALPKVKSLTPEEIVAHARQLPAVATLDRQTQAQRAQLEEYEASRRTVMTVGASVLHAINTGTGGILAIGVTPPLLDRGERERGVFAAEYERLRGQFESVLASGVSELTMLQHEVEHTQEVLDALERRVVPALEQATKERERLLELGEGSVLEALISRRALVSGQTRLSRARAAHGIAVWQWKLMIETTERLAGDAR